MTTSPHWEHLARCMLEALDGNPAEQELVLQGDPASTRAALKGKVNGLFDGMGDREFITVARTAQVAVGRVARAYRSGAS